MSLLFKTQEPEKIVTSKFTLIKVMNLDPVQNYSPQGIGIYPNIGQVQSSISFK